MVGSEIDTNEPTIQFGLTQDFSQGGARLLTQGRFEAGMNLKLSIFISETQEAQCNVEVIRCKRVVGQGTWSHEIAVKMNDHLDEEIVGALFELHFDD